jgi:hypothetical protein
MADKEERTRYVHNLNQLSQLDEQKVIKGKFLWIDFNNRTERKTVKPDNNLILLLITAKNREVDVQCELIWPRECFSNFHLSCNDDLSLKLSL